VFTVLNTCDNLLFTIKRFYFSLLKTIYNINIDRFKKSSTDFISRGKEVMRIRRYLSSLAVILVFCVTNSYAGIDQTYAERIVKENRDFIDFIDISITNFTPDKRNDLFNIYQKHFNAEVAYLQGDYKRAFDNIYDSQKDMVALYENMLTEYYLEDSKNILDGFAAAIIRTKNTAAKQYLTLGYRDRTVARAFYISGEASYPKLYSYKIYKYLEAINMARRAKRYAFISLYTGQTPKDKLKIYNQMFKVENEKGGIFFKRFIDKNEKDYITEMNKTYEESEQELPQKSGSTGGNIANSETADAKNVSFEKKMERSVRFRREQRVAQYLLNGEFDKAETIIRSYIEDYNFKLITATLNALDSAETHTGETDTSAEKKDYKKFIRHHNDNYKILNGKSILEDVSGDVKVVDSVKKEDKKIEDQEKIEGNTGKIPDSEANKKLEDAAKENKDIKDIKENIDTKDNKDVKDNKDTKDLPK